MKWILKQGRGGRGSGIPQETETSRNSGQLGASHADSSSVLAGEGREGLEAKGLPGWVWTEESAADLVSQVGAASHPGMKVGE